MNGQRPRGVAKSLPTVPAGAVDATPQTEVFGTYFSTGSEPVLLCVVALTGLDLHGLVSRSDGNLAEARTAGCV